MKYTDMQREKAAIQACAEWLKSKWGEHYNEMVRYLPAEDGEEVRQMLQRSIRGAMSHNPSQLVTMEEVNRQYCNLLDSHKLDTFERRMEMFKSAALAAEELATQAQQERAAVAAIIADAEEKAQFEESIRARAAEDAVNRKLASTPEGMKELRRKSLYPAERTSSQSVKMPASVRHICRSS